MASRLWRSPREGRGLGRRGRRPVHSFLFEPGHHGTKSCADLLNGMAGERLAQRLKLWTSRFVFGNPFLGKRAGLDLPEDFFHFLFGLGGYDARATRKLTVLRGIGDGMV